MAARLSGRRTWDFQRTDEGHRQYTIEWLVEVSNAQDGPGTVALCPGLPTIGSYWAFGTETDPWAFCQPSLRVTPILTNEPNRWWSVQQQFQTFAQKGGGGNNERKRCMDTTIEDPLLEPPRISGSFTKQRKVATKDRFGNALISTSHERIKGKDVEFDENMPNVGIELTLLTLPLSLLAQYQNVVNAEAMWGLPARCIKLSNASWQRLVYGACSFYYTVSYEFDINYNTFDATVGAEGRKCLSGWAPGHKNLPEIDPLAADHLPTPNPAGYDLNYENPANYIGYLDPLGQPGTTLLDTYGRPVGRDGAGENQLIDVEYYQEADLFVLGVPAVL